MVTKFHGICECFQSNYNVNLITMKKVLTCKELAMKIFIVHHYLSAQRCKNGSKYVYLINDLAEAS